MKIAYLEPKSSFRENLRSDTLWGLLCWGIKSIYSEASLDQFFNSYKEGSVLKVSSVFRFVKDDSGKKTLLFPKPNLKPLDLNEFFEKNKINSRKERAEFVKNIKRYKKVRYITKDIFDKFLTGELDEEKFFLSGLWGKEKLLFKKEDILHNSINRLTNTTEEGALFTTTETFVKNGGLFFLIDGNKTQTELVSGAINFFSHIGFGGDSSIGKNHFDVSIEDIIFPVVQNPSAFITLSLYSPTEDEIQNIQLNRELTWYELEARKGKFGGQFVKTGNFWKKSVLMFKEGSVFPLGQKTDYGKLINVKEDYDFPVYHFGYAFNLPINLK